MVAGKSGKLYWKIRTNKLACVKLAAATVSPLNYIGITSVCFRPHSVMIGVCLRLLHPCERARQWSRTTDADRF